MTNMSYCRFENTLHDLIDCHDQLEAMSRNDTFTEMTSQRERVARLAFIKQVLETADLLRDAMKVDADDDVSTDDIMEWVRQCENTA